MFNTKTKLKVNHHDLGLQESPPSASGVDGDAACTENGRGWFRRVPCAGVAYIRAVKQEYQ